MNEPLESDESAKANESTEADESNETEEFNGVSESEKSSDFDYITSQMKPDVSYPTHSFVMLINRNSWVAERATNNKQRMKKEYSSLNTIMCTLHTRYKR